jgi:5-methylcytosine-specific restriction endonuclease McrA
MKDRAINSGKWKKIRLTVLDRDGWLCAICNRPADTVDHIYPRVKGGSMWALDNLQCLCKSCNSRKGGRFFNRTATPPAFPETSLSKTVQIVPESPFNKPDTINFDEE